MITQLFLTLLVLAPQEEARPPSESECRKLVTRYLELEPDADEERHEILDQLSRVEPLSAAKARTWTKRILGSVEKGPELEDSPGVHELDGRTYFVAGKTSRPEGILIHLHGRQAPTPNRPVQPQNPFHLSAQKHDWVAIFPRRIDGDSDWAAPDSEALVLDLVDAALRTFRVDPDRVILSGTSAGALGAWRLAARHPDRFAGLAAFSGGPVPLLGGHPLHDGVIPNLRNLPISQFQAIDDRLTPVSMTREAARKLDEARALWGGFEWHYLEIPGTKHGAPPDGCDGVYGELVEARRNPRPERVVWQPTGPRSRRAYWLAWDAPKKGALVVADADRDGNAVHLTSEADLAGLRVLLDDELVDLDKDLAITVNGEEVFRGRAERRLDSLLLAAERGDEDLAFPASVRLP